MTAPNAGGRRPHGLREAVRPVPREASQDKELFQTAFVVLDANVLLSLYSLTGTARRELLRVLQSVSERLWIPHQVAAEFMEHRAEIVIQRNQEMADIGTTFQRASEAVVNQILSSAQAVLSLRQTSRTTEPWDPSAHGLAREALRDQANKMLEPLRAEVARIRTEYDLGVKDVDDPEKDPVLVELDQLYDRKVGPPFDNLRLRELIDEALHFRYPNKIPPGYADVGKPTPVKEAGDYLLWRQLIEFVRANEPRRPAIFVTADVKEDWWALDSRGDPDYPRPELSREFDAAAGASILILTPQLFLAGANAHLSGGVSVETISEVTVTPDRELARDVDYLATFRRPDTVARFRRVIAALQSRDYSVRFATRIWTSRPNVMEVRDASGNSAVVCVGGEASVGDSIQSMRLAMVDHGVRVGVYIGSALKPEALRRLEEAAIRFFHIRRLESLLDQGELFVSPGSGDSVGFDGDVGQVE